MFRSATFKLTMWYLAIAMAISLIFSVGLYRVTSGELNRGLHRESQRIFNQYPVFDNDPALAPPAQDLTSSDHRLLLRLVGLNILVFIGAGFSSYWLARRTLEPIEVAHEQQKRFTADVSHELRTPLTALKMESEVALLNGKLKAPELRATLQSNLEEIAKLESLINNLLRLSRLEANELQQGFTTVPIRATASKAITQVQAIADERKVKLDDSQIAQLNLHGDPESLLQLLVILLDNAIKYSQSGQSITISAKAANNRAVVTVSDDGVGIEPAALEHIFDRFYRADSSRNKVPKNEGYGLGLSIAKMIADVHGGSITLASRLNHGTTATLDLPLAAPELDKPSPQPAQ
jgi:two-component system sensor histidine kinase CiaH